MEVEKCHQSGSGVGLGWMGVGVELELQWTSDGVDF